MSNYRELVMEDLRLVVLLLLKESQNYELNSSVLQLAAQEYGHAVSSDTLHSELHWLAEQGLVGVRQMASIYVATLTARGLDVARGVSKVPGVKRPGPES